VLGFSVLEEIDSAIRTAGRGREVSGSVDHGTP
jgi:hypothetical protein